MAGTHTHQFVAHPRLPIAVLPRLLLLNGGHAAASHGTVSTPPPSVQCRPAEWPSWSRRLVWRPPPPAPPYLSLGFPPSCPSASQSPCDDACCFPDRVSNPSSLHRVRMIVHFPAAPLFRARTICPWCAGAWQCPPGRPGMEIAAAAYPSSALSIRGSMGKRWSCPLARQMLNLASSIASFFMSRSSMSTHDKPCAYSSFNCKLTPLLHVTITEDINSRRFPYVRCSGAAIIWDDVNKSGQPAAINQGGCRISPEENQEIQGVQPVSGQQPTVRSIILMGTIRSSGHARTSWALPRYLARDMACSGTYSFISLMRCADAYFSSSLSRQTQPNMDVETFPASNQTVWYRIEHKAKPRVRTDVAQVSRDSSLAAFITDHSSSRPGSIF